MGRKTRLTKLPRLASGAWRNMGQHPRSRGVLPYIGLGIIPPDNDYTRIVIISGSANNQNLRTIYNAVFSDVPSGNRAVITFIINAGVVLGSTSTATPALTTGSWPSGTRLILVNRGRIQGMGGNGGNGGTDSITPNCPRTNGTPGGPALEATFPISVDNSLGQIWSGGGGGGGGVEGDSCCSGGGGGGGGGAGSSAGTGGTTTTCGFTFQPGVAGNPGTSLAGGSGGNGGTFGGCTGSGGRGGDGGGPGLAGANASAESGCALSSGVAVGLGAAAGNYINGNSFVTWLANGDRRGGVA